jgi:hypothetical protein
LPVAQIFNLPYRRIAFGRALKNPAGATVFEPWQIENLRYDNGIIKALPIIQINWTGWKPVPLLQCCLNKISFIPA